ncbi:hypothetical protein LMG23992_00679 [Cupriavidus laharis]|uniref:SnoaL-like domain-containing protein n=1 Tax=Cupriavidus laharis TaxID=151654 RepID=A0ABN7XY55_9BURK|nr:hypothetical protein [Cupriavidus laharis]CAG9166067.1 hypothetical protein LMG23992_00679 [Cupriavidus laharis]
MTAIPAATAQALLNRYIEAKDNNRPEIIDEAFARDAWLTISLNTDAISFPSRTEGAPAIARTLVSDFARTFDRCRTYYIIDNQSWDGGAMTIPWLVAMRETGAGKLRVGRGYYRIGFTEADEHARIANLHIHIDRMDVVDDPGAQTLAILHESLPYPRLSLTELRAGVDRALANRPSLEYLRAFAEPAPLP